MLAVAVIITAAFFILGIIGTLLPVLPGALTIWAGMLIYGFFTDFKGLSFTFYIIQGLIVVAVMFVDYFAAALGTKYYGGSRKAVWGTVLGTIPGLVFFGPAGVIIGPFAGAVIAELVQGRPIPEAFRSGIGSLIGFLGGTVVKFTFEAAMIIWFLWRIL